MTWGVILPTAGMLVSLVQKHLAYWKPAEDFVESGWKERDCKSVEVWGRKRISKICLLGTHYAYRMSDILRVISFC